MRAQETFITYNTFFYCIAFFDLDQNNMKKSFLPENIAITNRITKNKQIQHRMKLQHVVRWSEYYWFYKTLFFIHICWATIIVIFSGFVLFSILQCIESTLLKYNVFTFNTLAYFVRARCCHFCIVTKIPEPALTGNFTHWHTEEHFMSYIFFSIVKVWSFV